MTEHALIILENGSRAIVSGGEGGIANLENVGTRNIIGHTHPFYDINGMNASDADRAALRALGQEQSLIFWRGRFYGFSK